ncbi:MAG: ATP-binding protein [Actinobacteria bacterium]|nr:ATP-binding protein [Actinomycetota bacterium]
MAELITQRIRRNAAELKLHGVAEDPDELIDRAEAAQLGYREFLDLILESELGVLNGRRYQARLKMAGLPHHMTLDEFDLSFQPDLDPKRRASAASNGSRTLPRSGFVTFIPLLWAIHLSGVGCFRGSPDRRSALSAITRRILVVVRDRRGLPGLPGVAALA